MTRMLLLRATRALLTAVCALVVTGVATAQADQVTNISAAGDHTCSVKADGTVWCWGDNGSGQLGDGTTTDAAYPVVVKGLAGVASVSTGSTHTCAVKLDGTVWCWGNGTDGQLGNGQTSGSLAPVAVRGLTDVASVATGDDYACAVKRNGSVWCWGSNTLGKLGNCVDVGSSHYWCWSDGKLRSVDPRDPQTIKWALPVPVLPPAADADPALLPSDPTPYPTDETDPGSFFTDVASVSAAADHTCAIRTDGTIWCWGQYGTTTNPLDGTIVPLVSTVPTNVAGLTGATSISAGAGHSCAVTSDHAVSCWGTGTQWELGIGSTEDSLFAPRAVLGLTDGASVTTGAGHSCAVRRDATLACWGAGASGQLGNGQATSWAIPVGVADLAGASAVAIGDRHSCALKNDRSVWCWGASNAGQLGDGSVVPSTRPVAVNFAGPPAPTPEPTPEPAPGATTPAVVGGPALPPGVNPRAPAPVVKLASSVKRTTLRKGVTASLRGLRPKTSVTVRISTTGTSKVATFKTKAKADGTAKIKLKLNTKARKKVRRAKRLTVVIKGSGANGKRLNAIKRLKIR